MGRDIIDVTIACQLLFNKILTFDWFKWHIAINSPINIID